MSVMMKNIDCHPYTGVRNVKGKVRVKTSEEAPWLDCYFDENSNADHVYGVTRGKVYNVVRIEGFGDCEDVTIIDDNGEEQELGDFFFDQVSLCL